MGFLYTISPFIKSDSLPSYASTARVISDYFYFFNIYSFNPYVIRDYMNFIDANFDYAFSELKLDMISYEYPDRLGTDESDILKYINDRYELYDTGFEITRELSAMGEPVVDLITGKTTKFYFNEYATYDSMLLTHSILSDIDDETIEDLTSMLKYIRNDETVMNIKIMLFYYEEYASRVDDLSSYGTDVYSNDLICYGVYILNQLKGFVQHEVAEREC